MDAEESEGDPCELASQVNEVDRLRHRWLPSVTIQPDSPAAQGGRGLSVLHSRFLAIQPDSPAAQGGRGLRQKGG